MRQIQPFVNVLILTIVGVVLLLVGLDAQGQEIHPDEYLRYLPLRYPKIVRQTEANAKLHLFGNAEDKENYQDTNPVDGIDDRRHKVLLDLAVQFSPILVLNSTMIPMDFRLFIEREETFRLFIDRWNISIDPPKPINSQEIDWQALSRPTSEAGSRAADADLQLLSLLEEFDPFVPGAAYRSGAVGPGRTDHKVMFFNFPGDGEETWKQEYVNQISKALPQAYEDFVKVFVHPFVESVKSSVDERWGYEFVLQYWFFYPYNDGSNNHEGDWEHINVFIKPLDNLHEPLSEAEVRQILTEGVPSDTAPNRLVIQKVDYYFHHKVITLDYTRPNVYQSREEWERKFKNTKEERFKEKWIWERLRYRAYCDDEEKKINTHPIGFIGGDNVGIDQMMRRPGSSNQVSNGTYPFRGRYKNVGQAGAAENISQGFDHRDYLDAGNHKRTVPENGYHRGSVVNFTSPDRIEILPDGERVMKLVKEKENAQARRDWAWLVLPIRWGYPATKSPFAGVIAHTDLGNSSVVGPLYNAGWNRSGGTLGFQVYSPHTFNNLSSLTWQDNFINNLGFLNLPVSSLVVLPPFDMVWYLVRLSSGRQNMIFQPNGSIPHHLIGGLTLGVTKMLLSSSSVYMVESDITRGQMSIEDDFMFHAEITFSHGDRFVSQNSLRWGSSTVGYDVSPDTKEGPQLHGELSLFDYSGSLRYNLTTGSFMIFVKGGYNLSWYRFGRLSSYGSPLSYSDGPQVSYPVSRHPLGFLPNGWHFGGGLEWTFKSSSSGMDIGIRGEALIYRPSFRINLNGSIPVSQGIVAPNASVISEFTVSMFNLAMVVAF